MSEEKKKLGPEGVTVLWQKVFELVKLITGDVDTSKGTLQEQIDAIIAGDSSGTAKETCFENYGALSEEEKNNGTLYLVPDAICVGDGKDAIEIDVIDGILCITYDDGIEEGSGE